MTGAVVSFTVITCSQEVLLPQASTATQVRTKLYGQSPAEGPSLKLTSTALHASVAVAIPVTAGATPAAQSTVMAAGQSITGAVVSITVTVCTTEAAFPQSSTAVNVREMIRSQLLPDSVTLTVTSTDSSQLSMAVAISAGMASVHSMVVSAGTEVKIGASSSVMVKVCSHVNDSPLKVPVNVRVMICGQVPETSSLKVQSMLTSVLPAEQPLDTPKMRTLSIPQPPMV